MDQVLLFDSPFHLQVVQGLWGLYFGGEKGDLVYNGNDNMITEDIHFLNFGMHQ